MARKKVAEKKVVEKKKRARTVSARASARASVAGRQQPVVVVQGSSSSGGGGSSSATTSGGGGGGYIPMPMPMPGGVPQSSPSELLGLHEKYRSELAAEILAANARNDAIAQRMGDQIHQLFGRLGDEVSDLRRSHMDVFGQLGSEVDDLRKTNANIFANLGELRGGMQTLYNRPTSVHHNHYQHDARQQQYNHMQAVNLGVPVDGGEAYGAPDDSNTAASAMSIDPVVAEHAAVTAGHLAEIAASAVVATQRADAASSPQISQDAALMSGTTLALPPSVPSSSVPQDTTIRVQPAGDDGARVYGTGAGGGFPELTDGVAGPDAVAGSARAPISVTVPSWALSNVAYAAAGRGGHVMPESVIRNIVGQSQAAAAMQEPLAAEPLPAGDLLESSRPVPVRSDANPAKRTAVAEESVAERRAANNKRKPDDDEISGITTLDADSQPAVPRQVTFNMGTTEQDAMSVFGGYNNPSRVYSNLLTDAFVRPSVPRPRALSPILERQQASGDAAQQASGDAADRSRGSRRAPLRDAAQQASGATADRSKVIYRSARDTKKVNVKPKDKN